MPRSSARSRRAAALSASLKGRSCSTIPDARRERRSARSASRAGGAPALAASAPFVARSRLHRSKSAIWPGAASRATSAAVASPSPAAAAAAAKACSARVLPAPPAPQREEHAEETEDLPESEQREDDRDGMQTDAMADEPWRHQHSFERLAGAEHDPHPDQAGARAELHRPGERRQQQAREHADVGNEHEH